jgi:hypothetical protein
LKKRTKKLLRDLVRAGRIRRVNQPDKSFLVLFFKKELLPCFPVTTTHPEARLQPTSTPRRGPPDSECAFKKHPSRP